MSPTLLIFQKEVREMARDKRVRSSAIFGPIILIVVLVYLFGFLQTTLSKPESQRIHVIREGSDNAIVEGLRKGKVNIIEVASVAEGEKLVREGRARVILHFEPGLNEALAAGETASITATYDPKNQTAPIAISIVERIVTEINKLQRNNLLASQGIDPKRAEPLQVVEKKLETGPKGGASELIIGFLPYLIVIWAFYGGMSIASDLVAGEKEKATLETLLIAPVNRSQIAMGKFLALGAVCFVSSLSSLVGLAVMSAIKLPMTAALFKDGLGVSPQAAAVTLLVMLPTVALFAGVLLAISAFAKNPREAQTHLTLVSFVVLMPALFSQFIGFTDYAQAKWVGAVPVLNSASSIRNALLGKFDAVSIGLTIIVSAVLAAAAVAIAVRMFNREEVLTRV